LTFAQVVNVGRPTGARSRASPRWTHRRTTSASINNNQRPGSCAAYPLARGAIQPTWSSEECVADTGKTRGYVSCDGVKVPLVTDEEKKTRRKKVRQTRRRRGRKCKPLAQAKLGSDNAWEAYRVVAHYDEKQTHCQVSVMGNFLPEVGRSAPGRSKPSAKRRPHGSKAPENVGTAPTPKRSWHSLAWSTVACGRITG